MYCLYRYMRLSIIFIVTVRIYTDWVQRDEQE
jgi:hypothetical protein